MIRARRRMTAVALGLVVCATLAAACSSANSDGAARKDGDATSTSSAETRKPTLDDALRLDQIQVLGTHNSFHVAAPKVEHDLLVALSPDQAAQRTYSHRPLPEQLEKEQVRQIELDVFADASGGLYANPSLRRQAGLPPYVSEVPAMADPGTKVLHEQDVDYHSVCPVFTDCLKEVARWSKAHPTHVPIAISVQLKDGPLIFAVPDQAVPEKWFPPALDRLDGEIRSVFGPGQLITPDDVRGKHDTLEQAVLDHAWPTLGESRGKVLFLMINGEPYRTLYLDGHPGLQGRVMFTNAEPGQPDASYIGVDDPIAGKDRIADLVGKGYLVRTRADEPNKQERTGDTTVRDAALASGAQWISTDYPAPKAAETDNGGTYSVDLPGGVAARCNPVTAPKRCQDAAVEPR